MKLVSKTSTKPERAGRAEKLTLVAPTLKTIAALREAARDCKACDLWKTGTQTVFGEGPSKAQIMFVGEQPGDREDRAALGAPTLERVSARPQDAWRGFLASAEGRMCSKPDGAGRAT